MTHNYSISALAVAVLLVGCGGGGGSSSSTSNTPEPPTDDLPTVFITVDEATQTSRYIRDRFAYEQAKVVGDDSMLNDVSFDGNDVIVDAKEVDRPSTFELDLVNDEFGKVANLRILVDNTSGKPLENTIGRFISQRSEILGMYETYSIVMIALDAAYLKGNVSASAQASAKMDFDPSGSAGFAQAEAGADSIESALEEYRQGLISESQLSTAFDDGLADVDAIAAYGQEQVDTAFMVSGMSPVPTVGTLSADQDRLLISRYVGNSGFGAYTGDNWNYDSSFAYFKLIR